LLQKYFKYVSELQVGEEVERALANFAPPKVGFRYNAYSLVPQVVLGDLSTSLSQPAVTYSRMKFG
jgi:hypothetical protein